MNLALTLGLFGVMATNPIMAADEPDHHSAASHENHALHMLEGYAVVSTALYKDDLEAAKKAAAGMIKHDKDSSMAKPAQAIADSKTLEEARAHFKHTFRT